MRLCYIANPDSIHTQRWVNYFAEREHEVYLIGLPRRRTGISISGGFFPSNVVFHRLAPAINMRKMRYLPLVYAVRRLVREIQPDVLHAHQVIPAGLLGATTGYHPLVVTAWGSDLLVQPKHSRVNRWLAGWTLRQADYTTCVSEQLVSVARDLGADPSRLEMAPWGVDTQVFHPADPDPALREQFNLGPGPVVLSLRPIRPIYNPLDIARAIPYVVDRVPGVRFVVRTYACDRDLFAQFQTIVHQHGATGAVQYVGDLPDDHAIADLYRMADVAVSVPSSDGTPLSVLESLACGTPVVLSDLPALREWVQEQQEGLFAPVGDVQAVGAAIVRLVVDDALRRRLRANGLALIQQRADSRVWMARAEEIYRGLIG